MHELLHVLEHSFIDTFKLVSFLFLTCVNFDHTVLYMSYGVFIKEENQ